MNINYSLQFPQPEQATPSSNHLTHSQEAVMMAEYSFFYRPCNDFQMYCTTSFVKKYLLPFELVSQLIIVIFKIIEIMPIMYVDQNFLVTHVLHSFL